MKKLIQYFFACTVLVLNYISISAQSVQTGSEFKTALPMPAHIVIVIFENHSFNQIINGSIQTEYFNTLALDSNAALFTNSHGLTHPSQPNYLFLFSGSNNGVTKDRKPSYKFTSPNLAASLIAAGNSFKTYSEDLPYTGSDIDKAGTGDNKYVRKHNALTNWINDTIGIAHENQVADTLNQSFSAFTVLSDHLDFAKLPTVSFVIPNLENDMHGASLLQIAHLYLSLSERKESEQAGNNWLLKYIKPYADWAKQNNSLLIITFDEGWETLPEVLKFKKDKANLIPTIFVGPMVKPGQYSERITHDNILATLLNMYNLSPQIMGDADREKDAIKYCWK